MTRNIKFLVLLMVSVFAVSGLGTPTGAAGAQFTATSGAQITAQTNLLGWTVTGQTFTCNKEVFSGTAPAASFASITFNAEFAECKMGPTTATITGFGQHGEPSKCDFVFYAAGTIDLLCPAGQEMTLDGATCIVHIPSQIGFGTVTYTNSGKHLDVGFNVVKTTSTHTDGFLCPFGSGGPSKETATESSSALTFVPSVGSFSFDS